MYNKKYLKRIRKENKPIKLFSEGDFTKQLPAKQGD